MPDAKKKKRFTYADYLTWPEDEHWELIEGEAFDMAPAPSPDHQFVVGRLNRFFDEFFEGKTCHSYVSPFEVRLPKGDEADENIETVVHPDISIVCDPEKLDGRGYRGAPDLVVEVLSPSTASYDAIRKRRLYEEAGVKEYWLIDTGNRLVIVQPLQKSGAFGRGEFFADDSSYSPEIFPGLVVDFSRIFPPVYPTVKESPRAYKAKK